ncbi:hypothetical protein BLA29_013642 [Euroglyphus maynei]|uniref:Uncharacterized protein n=1 Tax=Euroglyphus maynei TaxID=6958 RepID=A0A1Y3BQM5_EURMA|nr:hypothetical protein BLA29_013642 [Euroglyphus maynei]
MPKNPFIQPSPHKNPMIPCFKFSDFDYDLWKDDKKNVKYSTTMSKPATVVYGSSLDLPKKPPPTVMAKMPPAIGYSKQYHYQYNAKSPKNFHHQDRKDHQ